MIASSPETRENPLQVLAATASNDQKLRERYRDDKSSNSSPISNHDEAPAPDGDNLDDKSNDANSDDDESGSGCSGSSGSAVISKTTGLRKGKWTVRS
jgi:hypothetical protein